MHGLQMEGVWYVNGWGIVSHWMVHGTVHGDGEMCMASVADLGF